MAAEVLGALGILASATIELLPQLSGDERPSDYASLAAEQIDLDNVINELKVLAGNAIGRREPSIGLAA
ncbi:hypothetical protein [Mycolicibacterium vulneris]|uniref:hypothetical protein n=1 Tax=Mycolicibacterium vulneris TaxID=547163 RepID=UPI001056B3EA|nr:hypothetical protein [Mycolicibacterium vulneris]